MLFMGGVDQAVRRCVGKVAGAGGCAASREPVIILLDSPISHDATKPSSQV